jgi:hypothetical protein
MTKVPTDILCTLAVQSENFYRMHDIFYNLSFMLRFAQREQFDGIEHRRVAEHLRHHLPQHGTIRVASHDLGPRQVIQENVGVKNNLVQLLLRNRRARFLKCALPENFDSVLRNLITFSRGSSWTVAIRSISSSVTFRFLSSAERTLDVSRMWIFSPAPTFRRFKMAGGMCKSPDSPTLSSNSVLTLFTHRLQ